MVGGKELAPEKCAQIMILHKEKMPIRVIAKKVKVAHSTVVASVKRMIEQNNFKSRNRCGRPRVTTKRVGIAIVKTAKFSPKASSSVHDQVTVTRFSRQET